ncbi:MAG: protoheme IX farnesyltransferase [Phycisphaerales bacterium]|nr:protoheme IX farnesyltransferase [Phycisphaerales bacterium]
MTTRSLASPLCGESPVPAPSSVLPHAGQLVFVLLELMKLRLTGLAAMASVVGFVMASGASVNVTTLLCVALGAFLVGGGANALNQFMERDLDALMSRTRHRPLPSGRLTPKQALWFGGAAGAVGLLVLAAAANPIGAVFALLTLVIYLGAYTPLKRISAWNTVVGAAPGALPVLIGWGASGARLSSGAWSLFLLVVVWQLPHFFAICRLWREDYIVAGYAMWPLSDASGRRTGAASALLCAALIPVSLLPTWVGLTGMGYAFSAGVLGMGFLASALAMAIRPCERTERLVFLTSIVYLPLVMLAMMFDRA